MRQGQELVTLAVDSDLRSKEQRASQAGVVGPFASRVTITVALEPADTLVDRVAKAYDSAIAGLHRLADSGPSAKAGEALPLPTFTYREAGDAIIELASPGGDCGRDVLLLAASARADGGCEMVLRRDFWVQADVPVLSDRVMRLACALVGSRGQGATQRTLTDVKMPLHPMSFSKRHSSHHSQVGLVSSLHLVHADAWGYT